MRDTDAVWRTLADAALGGRREWKNVADLAWEAGVGEKLAYKALLRPAEIGAVTKHSGGGFSVTDPERVLTLFAAARSLRAAKRTSVVATQYLLSNTLSYCIGGTRAVAHFLGDGLAIADHAPAIVYVPENTPLDHLPPGDDSLVLTLDTRTLELWRDGFTSPAQTYADLFAQSGWQASEFRRALWRTWFEVDDWSKAEGGP